MLCMNIRILRRPMMDLIQAFTNEQLKEVAKLEARFTKAIAKKAIERVGSALEGIVDGLSGDN